MRWPAVRAGNGTVKSGSWRILSLSSNCGSSACAGIAAPMRQLYANKGQLGIDQTVIWLDNPVMAKPQQVLVDRPILSTHDDMPETYRFVREHGSADWMLTLTVSGAGLIRSRHGS